MNDWWSYLAHAQKAEERKGHKYIARVEVGTKRGRTIYRYFYTMDQYKQYLSQKEKGVKSEAEKRQSPLYNLKRVATQIKNLLNDRDRAVNDVNLGQRDAAYKRMEYDKALLKSAGKDFLDSIKDKLKIPVKDADKAAGAENVKKHLYIKRVTMPNGKYRYFYTESSYEKYLQRVKYQAEEPDFMKDIPKIDLYTDESDAQAQADINEEYSVSSFARSHNCIFCTNAYELRQRGYNVQAADSRADRSDKKYEQYDHSILNWYEDPDFEVIMNDGTTKNVNKAMEYYNTDNTLVKKFKRLLDKETQSQLNVYGSSRIYKASDLTSAIKSKCPSGSRGQFTVTWKSGGGHSVVFEVDKHGNVIFRDTQVNQIYTAEFLAENINSARFIRTDNLKLKPDILYTVEEN